MTKNTPITKDWLMLGMLTGVGGAIAKELVNYGLFKKNIPTVRYASIAGGAVLGKRATFGIIPKKPRTTAEWAIGHVGDIVLGGLFGSTLSYVISKSPPGNEITKGIGGGVTLWATTLAFGNLLNLDGLARIKPNQMASLLAVSALFGGTQGYFLGKYREGLIEPSYPIKVQETSDDQYKSRRMGNRRTRNMEKHTNQPIIH